LGLVLSFRLLLFRCSIWLSVVFTGDFHVRRIKHERNKLVFKDLKVTCVKAEGKCSRSKVGTTFYIRNARLEIPPGESVCIFALGSILQPITAAIIKNQKGEGILDVLQEWQCPDPLAKVIFRIEEEEQSLSI